jgi:uncharacterized protein (DUF1778 family)
MPREHVESGRIELRLKPEDKAVLARAAALERLDLTSFILRAALPRAQAVITESEKLRLSERDSLRVLDLLENPPDRPRASSAPPRRASCLNDGPPLGGSAAWQEPRPQRLQLRRGQSQHLPETLCAPKHESGGAKCFVATPRVAPARILGFYTLSPASIEFSRSPTVVTRGLGRY